MGKDTSLPQLPPPGAQGRGRVATEHTPMLQDEHESTTAQQLTTRQVLVHILKANIGPGCLSLPNAWSMVGFTMAPLLLVLVVVPAIYCMLLLVWARRAAAVHRVDTFGDLGEFALGRRGRVVIDLFVGATQLGVCTVFTSFTATNVQAILASVSSAHPPYSLLVLCQFPLLFVMSLTPSFAKVTWLMVVGNVLLLAGVVLVLAVLSPRLADELPRVPSFLQADWSKAPTFVGSVLYSFEGIALVLPLENAMHPQHAPKYGRVLVLGMTIVACVFVVVGSWCFVALGGDVSSGSISASLKGFVPSSNILATNALLTGAVLAAFPINILPVVQILEVWGFIHTGKPVLGARRIALRFATVVLIVGLGASSSHLGLVISLIGSLCTATLGLVLPPVLHLRILRPTGMSRVVDLALIAFGATATAVGTVTAAWALVEGDE